MSKRSGSVCAQTSRLAESSHGVTSASAGIVTPPTSAERSVHRPTWVNGERYRRTSSTAPGMRLGSARSSSQTPGCSSRVRTALPSRSVVLGEVGGDVGHRRGDLRPELGVARVVDLHREQPVGPPAEQLAVPGRKAQQFGDDDHRQRERERVDEVEPFAHGVEELAGHGADAGLEGGDGARGERGADQVAQGAVLRRVVGSACRAGSVRRRGRAGRCRRRTSRGHG